MKIIERSTYKDSLRDYRDLKSALATSFKEGKEEIAKNTILEGASNEFIADITDLSVEQIKELREKNMMRTKREKVDV
ncbi:MAG: hypothetical protein AAF740_04645 [Bacteroidota bacterium]